MEEHIGEELDFVPEYSMMELFDELSFSEKWSKVFAGLKMDKDSGDYKFAKLQLLRLMAPISAVVVPIIAIGVIAILAQIQPPPPPPVEIMIQEPDQVEELDDIEEIKEEPPEPPDPVEISEIIPDVDVVTDVPTPPTEFSPVPTEFDSVAMIKSPMIMKGILGSRNPGARGAARAMFGGNNATEGAVMRALRWLKHTQQEDGSWKGEAKKYKAIKKKPVPPQTEQAEFSKQRKNAIKAQEKARSAYTAMALLTFLAHGETPASPEFGFTVESAIGFLLDSHHSGRFKHGDKNEYTLPIAAYALSEASALVRVSSIEEAATAAIRAIVKGQHGSGGWDYNLRGGDRDDTSYMGWCAQALKAAKMADLDVDGLEQACKKSIEGFKKNADPNGGFGYTDARAKNKLDGVGVLCMQLHGEGKSQEVIKGLKKIKKTSKVTWEMPKNGKKVTQQLYYWYYNTQAMFHAGGEYWKPWNKQFAKALVKNQVKVLKEVSGYTDHKSKPQDIGFWVSPMPAEHTGGNTQDTCLCALQLQVYYRYLPTFKSIGDLAPPPDAEDEEEEEKIEGKDVVVDIRI